MKTLLEEPALHGVDIGSTEWFALQRSLIEKRPLVKRAYDLWYSTMLADVATVPGGTGGIVELGSGSNYVKSLDPSVITSDVVSGGADMVIDARSLPFKAESLRGVLLTHVFHHIPDVTQFLSEAIRTLVPGGVISLIDVTHSPLARLLFGRFHPEAYRSDREGWLLDTSGTYGGADQALSWVVFHRDRERFERQFPGLRVEVIESLPWLGYLLSGGLTRKNIIPRALVPLISTADQATTALNGLCALHWHIRIRKVC